MITHLAKAALAATIFFSASAFAVDSKTPPNQQTLFKNVMVFDGTNDKLYKANVLVKGHLIAEVSKKSIKVTDSKNTTVIDGDGRTLMPGLIEAHNHLMFPVPNSAWFNTHDMIYISAVAAEEAKGFLLRGWTTVRDIGGPSMGLHRAVEDGRIIGPRILSSSAVIGQTSGHGDMRDYNDPHPNMVEYTHPFFDQFSFIADGPDEVRRAVREALRRGAVQIKVMAGGGVSSTYDPIYTAQYSAEEFRAATEAAADYGTYVAVHAYTDKSIIRAINNGVKVIEHGQLMTEKSVKLILDNDIWIGANCQVLNLSDEEVGFLNPIQLAKFYEIKKGLDNQMKLIKKYNIKMSLGTDIFGSSENFKNARKELSCRKQWFTSAEIAKQATSVNGEFLELAGKRNPYQDGPIGVIKKGAYADILIVKGDPLKDVAILEDYEKNIQIIMKDGVIYKNSLK